MPHRQTVKGLMTPFPYSIEWDEPVENAVKMMEEHDIRHLPVTRGSDLYGIVSDADLRVMQALRDQEAPRPGVQVGLICTTSPYTVDLDTPVPQVIDEMLGRHIGSVLVTRKGQLAGILTTTDLCAFLATVLRQPPPPDRVA